MADMACEIAAANLPARLDHGLGSLQQRPPACRANEDLHPHPVDEEPCSIEGCPPAALSRFRAVMEGQEHALVAFPVVIAESSCTAIIAQVRGRFTSPKRGSQRQVPARARACRLPTVSGGRWSVSAQRCQRDWRVGGGLLLGPTRLRQSGAGERHWYLALLSSLSLIHI